MCKETHTTAKPRALWCPQLPVEKYQGLAAWWRLSTYPKSPDSGLPHPLQYLWIPQAGDVGVQIELDASPCTGQCQSTNQQHQEHGKREGGREVDDLGRKESDLGRSKAVAFPQRLRGQV